MRTIYKFPLDNGVTTIAAGDPIVRHVGVDPSGDPHMPCLWIEVTVGGDDSRSFTFIGTGHIVPAYESYVGSTVAGPYVWHVYEVED